MSKFKGQRNAKFQSRTILKSLPASLYPAWAGKKTSKGREIFSPFRKGGWRGI
jgi:hypothetical protein